MSVNPEIGDERAGMRSGAGAALGQLAGPERVVLSSLPLRRWLAGYALAAVLTPVLTLLLASLRGQLNLTTDVLAFLVAVIAVALVGGVVPAVLEAMAGWLLLNFYFTPPIHKLPIAEANNAAALGVFVVVAVVVSFLVDDAERHTKQAAQAAEAAHPIAEADRTRAALLAAVSHDLRTPLASAKAAVSGLRSRDIQLTAEDHDELLATADESLDLLTHLVADLLDVSRLQAGALPVFPRPADLEEIIARSLDDIGLQARAVMVDIPHGLPEAMVDPVIMERVVANVTANALRYSPAGLPPLLTASTHGDWVELRVVDRGPGVPEADRDRMFMPFQRLADTENTTGVGLGLALSRGLTEAMRGALEPEETPGGGLTMAISVPAVPGRAQAYRGEPGGREPERIGSAATAGRGHNGA
jgi:two-component system sensor histidine kinase KdpD